MNEALPFPFKELTGGEEHGQKHTLYDVISVLLKSEICASCFWVPTGVARDCQRPPEKATESRRGQEMTSVEQLSCPKTIMCHIIDFVFQFMRYNLHPATFTLWR